MKRAAALAGYLFFTWLFGGRLGLVLGVLIVVVWSVIRPRRDAFYGAAVLFLVAAPFAIIAQGLARTPAPGGGWGTQHMVAHVLVGCSLALAGFAGLGDLLGWWKSGSVVQRRGWGAAPPAEPEAVSAEPDHAAGPQEARSAVVGDDPDPGSE